MNHQLYIIYILLIINSLIFKNKTIDRPTNQHLTIPIAFAVSVLISFYFRNSFHIWGSREKIHRIEDKKTEFSPSWLIIHIKRCFSLSWSKFIFCLFIVVFHFVIFFSLNFVFFLFISFVQTKSSLRRNCCCSFGIGVCFIIALFLEPIKKLFKCCPDFEVTQIDQWID